MEMHFMIKRFHMSLRDLDPEGIIRHEDLVGLRQLEEWYILRDAKDAARQRAKGRHTSKKR